MNIEKIIIMAPSDTKNEEGSGIQLKTQDHLMPQNPDAIDPAKLTALTPEVVSLSCQT